MSWTASSILGCSLALNSLAGCSQPSQAMPVATGTPTPLLQMERREIDAERIQADFTLLDLPVGDVVMQLCPGGPDREATIETEIRTAALIRAVRRVGGSARTTLRRGDISPQTTETLVYDGDMTRSYRVNYGVGSFDYEYVKSSEAMPKRGKRTLAVPATIHDLHSAFLLLRAWKPRLGEEAHLFVVLGRQLWRVDARSAGRKVLLVRGSPRVTTRIDGEARRLDAQDAAEPSKASRTFSLWFEEGVRAIPVRVTATSSFGEVTMTLTSDESGATLCAEGPKK